MREDPEVRALRDRVRMLEGQLSARGGGGAGPAGCAITGVAAIGLVVIAGGAAAFMFLAPSTRGPDPVQQQLQAEEAARQAQAQAQCAMQTSELQAQLAMLRAESEARAASGDPRAASDYVDDDAVYDGRVTATSGASHVHVADTCRVDLAWTTDPGRNCRALVDCGTRRVYGDVGQGWFPCSASGDEGLRSGEDDAPTSDDGDPRFHVDRVAGTVQISDDAPSWSLTLAISPRAEDEDPPDPASVR